MASNKRELYPFHTAKQLDANLAYCRQARIALARLRAKRSNIIMRLVRAIMGK